MDYSAENQESLNRVRDLLNPIDYNVVLIHSDIVEGFRFNYKLRKEELLQAHYSILKSIFPETPIWMPTFNYSFPSTKEYDVNMTKSEVGVLTEYFRTKCATWRSEVPVFSFAGEGVKPQIYEDGVIDAFGANSIFEQLVKKDALIMLYGKGFESMTFLHHCEQMAAMPYRYFKNFKGKVFFDNIEREVTLKYFVRPLNKVMYCDVTKIEYDLGAEGLLQKTTPINTYLIKAKNLFEYLVYRMKKDPLYLLTKETQVWVEPMLQKLGRPFLITDFE